MLTAATAFAGMIVHSRLRPTHFLIASVAILVSPLAGAVAAADSLPLAVESKIELGDVQGRIDHLAVDLKRQRLYVAELGNDTMGVVDLKESKVVQTLRGLKEPQGIGYEPTTDTVYVANGKDGTVRLYKGADLAPLGSIELGDDADNVRIEEAAHRVWVGYGSGSLAAIDANSRHKVADIPLPAHPESFRLDPDGPQIFVNLPRARQIAVVDRSAGKQVAAWKTDLLLSNFPLAFDDTGQILSVFRIPARLVVFRKQDGQRLQVLDTCGDSDDLSVDVKRHRVYVTCGEGAIDVFSHAASGYQHVGKLKTSPGARTSLFVPELDRLYLAVRASSSTPAAIWVVRPESVAQTPSAVQTNDSHRVVFVCEHGSVKSLIATLYFNQRAQQRGLRYTAVARGTSPDAAVPATVQQGLRAAGFDVVHYVPQSLKTSDVDGASLVVSFDQDITTTVAGRVRELRWDNLPAVLANYQFGRDEILKRVDDLIDQLARATRAGQPGGTQFCLACPSK